MIKSMLPLSGLSPVSGKSVIATFDGGLAARLLVTLTLRQGRCTSRQRIQMILLRESGMTQPAIAAAMGVSLSTVNRARIDHGGIKALKPKPSGGRLRAPELL
jgi:Winged helix-turn helix